MPQGVRYMSEAADYLRIQIPWFGKKILDKTLTGCGGTEYFGNSGRPLVLVSPRTGVLINKAKQHLDWLLYRNIGENDLVAIKERLKTYLNYQPLNGIPVILVTLDSAHYVIEELQYRGIIDNFLFLVDEFQCLMCDAAYKADVDLKFLKLLDSTAKNICYMSATPIPDYYLDLIPEFMSVDYYKLNWDPNVVVEPTVKEIRMESGVGPVSIMKKVVSDFKRDGYFAKKIHQGQEVYSTELVVFVNEVKTIYNIINSCNLKPDEVTILISSSSKYVDVFKKGGYHVEGQIADKNNPVNTTYTFCSKASFEGRDFYSNCAFTIIFLDGSKEWETHDTTIEIPQMLGRQRLDTNPFRYNALIYFRTKPTVVNEAEYMKSINDKLVKSESLIRSYENTPDVVGKEALIDLVKGVAKDNKYKSNYLDVVDNPDGTYKLATNFLVAAAEHMLWANKEYFYSHPMQLSTAIQNQMAASNRKTQDLRDFEKQFNQSNSFTERIMLYCSHLQNHPEDTETLMANPFIEQKFHCYYSLGVDLLRTLGFDEVNIQNHLANHAVIRQCNATFNRGSFYTLEQVKEILQGIYNNVYLQKSPTATAKQLESYMNVKMVQKIMQDGSRPRGYVIV